MLLQKLEDVVGGARADGAFGVTELVDEQAKQVLLLLGLLAEEGGYEVQRLQADVAQGV